MRFVMSLLAISLVMLFSCSKDTLTDENPDLKKAKVPIPMKVEICMISNTTVDSIDVENTPVLGPSGQVLIPALGLSGAAWLSGHGTLIGEMIQEESTMVGHDAYLDMDALFTTGRVVIVAVYEGRITAANHDYFDFISNIRIDATDPSDRVITGDVSITNGTGKFEGMTGKSNLYGILPCWRVEGTVKFMEQ